MILILQPGESRMFPTAARFLNVLAASDPFIIANHDAGLPDTQLKSGWIVDVQDYTSVDVSNPNDSELQLELQSSALRIQASGSESVEVSNKLVIERIEQGIEVNAAATIEGGTVASLGANQSQPLATHTVAPGETLKLCDARDAPGRAVVVQVYTDDDTAARARLGAEAPTESAGVMLLGSGMAPASHEWATQTAVYIRNTGTGPLKVTGAEHWRDTA
ncbi:hypothetical protein [Ferrimonas balearica]|uniref:hypothetical protein n=1 Tax=Ferrimonas balearica TaxID=44012 RepID=UPI001C99D05E|nr:hypothetical protein [Ferrimonas balearica]MBY5920418.1 hypothetical protein [Ferrimonas balearica]MBY5996897.1 hypothetical protein [Ferrimonas balearica]